MSDPNTVYLAGTPEGEHLRLRLSRPDILAVSHEQVLAGRGAMTQWREHIFFSVPRAQLEEAIQKLGA